MGVTPWVRHTPERAMNRKLREAGFAARGLDDAAICQIAADDSDSFISEETVEVLAVAHREKNWRKVVDTLCKVGRWEQAEGGWIVHDYEEFNYSKAYWEKHKQQKRAAGQRGGQANAKARAKPSATAPGQADARAGAKANGSANGGASAEAASLRFATSSVKSSSTHVGGGPTGDDDDRLDQALRLLAERDLERREAEVGPVGNRSAWLNSAVRKRRSEHEDDLEDLAGLAVTEIVERLAPAPVEDLEEGASRAAAEQRRRQSLPSCEACENTGWKDADPARGKCRCGRLMTAAERRQIGAA